MLTIYFERKSELSAFANNSGKAVVRCKLPCGHVNSGRDAALLLEGSIVVAKLIRCKVCNQLQKGVNNE